jgi:hypothetical protein
VGFLQALKPCLDQWELKFQIITEVMMLMPPGTFVDYELDTSILDQIESLAKNKLTHAMKSLLKNMGVV